MFPHLAPPRSLKNHKTLAVSDYLQMKMRRDVARAGGFSRITERRWANERKVWREVNRAWDLYTLNPERFNARSDRWEHKGY